MLRFFCCPVLSHKNWLPFSVLAIFIAVMTPHPLYASTSLLRGTVMTVEQFDEMWSSLSDKKKFGGIDGMIRKAMFDEARSYLGRMKKTPQNQVMIAFYEGVINKNTGKLDEAAATFRGLLADNPKLSRVRLELGHTLFLMKEDVSARHHFDLVMASGSQRSLQTTVQSFIDAMDKRRKWHMSAYATLAPSTNMNQGTDNSSIIFNNLEYTIDEGSKRKSGIGLHGGVTGGGHIALTDKIDLVAAGGGHLKKYEDEKFDDVLVTASLGPRLNLDKGHIGLYGIASHRWFGQEAYSLNFGSRFTINYRLNERNVLNSGLMWEHRTHDLVAYRNSDYFRLNGRLDHYFSSHSFVRTLASFEHEVTQKNYLDYTSMQAGLGYYTELPLGVTFYGQGQYSERDYDGLFPGSLKSRHDERFDFLVHLTKRDWNIMDYAPSLVYNYVLNDSNIEFNQYDAHNINLTLSKKF